MKKFSKIAMVVLVLSISCKSYKSITITKAQQFNDIWKKDMQKADQKGIDELVNKYKVKSSTIKFSSDSALYYTTDNNLVLASIYYDANPPKISFEERFKGIKGVHNELDYGFKLISYAGQQKGADWIYTIEYTDRDNPDKYRYFYMETYVNTRAVRAEILTDPAHRDKAITLVNTFTQSLMNVTLDLTPNN